MPIEQGRYVPDETSKRVIDAAELIRLWSIELRAREFVADLRRRYPGQAFTCPFVAALDQAVQRKA